MQVPTVSIDAVPNPLPAGLHVLDVREDAEWRAGHIEGALHIPMMELGERLDDVPLEQTLVVCKVGGRSAQASAWLVSPGRDVVRSEERRVGKEGGSTCSSRRAPYN